MAFLPIAFLIGILIITISTFGSDALGGASQIALLTTTAVCVLMGMSLYGRSWKEYEEAITERIGSIGTAIIILLIIGKVSRNQ